MGQDQSDARPSLKRKGVTTGGAVKKTFSISHSNIGMDLVNLGNVEDFEVDEFDFETNSVLAWTKAELEEFLVEIGFKATEKVEDAFGDDSKTTNIYHLFTEKLLKRVATGKELFGLKFKDKFFTDAFDLKKQDQLLLKETFWIYLLHLKKIVKYEQTQKDQPGYIPSEARFSLKFHRVLQKVLNGLKGDASAPLNYKQLEHYVSLLASRYKIKKFLLDGKKLEVDKNNKKDEKERKVKIKLIITENTFDPKDQFIRKIVSPIVSIIPKFKPAFGFFHSAILVGPYYLQWTDSQVVIPKKIISSGCALISLDTNPIEIESEKDFDEIKLILAEVIETWNTNYTYVQLRKNPFEGNCQDFCAEVAKKLNININKGDVVISDYLNKFTKRGYYKIQFKPNEKFCESFYLDSKNFPMYNKIPRSKKDKRLKFNFKTHKDLDDFLFYCYLKNPEGIYKFESEYRLLKSFDRAFWLRHLKFPDDETFKPSKISKNRKFGDFKPCGCLFGDPRSTGSYS